MRWLFIATLVLAITFVVFVAVAAYIGVLHGA